MSAGTEDAWKVRTRAAIADLIAALGALYDTTQMERLMAARANLERAIEAFPQIEER